MTRLTKRNGRNITYNEKREFICSHYCNNCSRGTGDCEILKTMIEKLADYEDAEEMKENGCSRGKSDCKPEETDKLVDRLSCKL